MAYDIYKLANMLLKLAEDRGEPLLNMGLQKLLYYEQGYHLARFNKPLFSEKIKAWFFGPGLPCIKQRYEEHGNCQIRADRTMEDVDFKEEDERELFLNVFNTLSLYSATGVARMARSESPCRKAERKNNLVITKASMKSYFKKRLREN